MMKLALALVMMAGAAEAATEKAYVAGGCF